MKDIIDIVIPLNNEEEFILMAGRLGYTGICFLYTLEDYLINKQSRRTGTNDKIGVYYGALSNIFG